MTRDALLRAATHHAEDLARRRGCDALVYLGTRDGAPVAYVRTRAEGPPNTPGDGPVSLITTVARKGT